MTRVFVLEDQATWREIIGERLAEVGGGAVEFEMVESVAAAERLLLRRAPGYFDLLLFDLQVPRTDGGGVGEAEKDAGLDAAMAAWNAGHRNHLVVLSIQADYHVARHAELEHQGIRIEKWLSKPGDLVTEEHWREHFGPFLADLDPLIRRLEIGPNALYVVDGAQRQFLRAVVEAVRRSTKVKAPHLPVLYFTGSSGSGKTWWTRALPMIKRYVQGGLTEDWDATEYAYEYRDLGALGDGFNDSHRLALFGAKTWSTTDSTSSPDGDLVRATCYQRVGRGNVLRNTSNPADLTADRDASGVFVGDEVLNASPELLNAFLGVISMSVVPLAGVDGVTVPVGCTVAFASNLEAPNAVVQRHAERRGEVTEAFRSRLGRALNVPQLSEMQLGSVLELLARLARREVGPDAAHLVAKFHTQGWLTVRDLFDVSQYSAGARVDRAAVDSALANRAALFSTNRQTPSAPPLGREAAPGRSRAMPPGWPVGLDIAHVRDAMRTWDDVVKTKGACINNDLDQVIAGGKSAYDLLALIVVAQFAISSRMVAKADVESWLNLTQGNSLRHKVRLYNKRYPKVFVGRRYGGGVDMLDIEQWARTLPALEIRSL